MNGTTIQAFWFRRDLRLDDNHGLFRALASGGTVLPIFIFDTDILEDLPGNDPRAGFIWDQCMAIDRKLKTYGSSLLIRKGKPVDIWEELLDRYPISAIYFNHDYEPYALLRDEQVSSLCRRKGVAFQGFKDQVIYEKSDVLKDDGTPYTVYTPYSKKWLKLFKPEDIEHYAIQPGKTRFFPSVTPFPSKAELGFESSEIKVRAANLSKLEEYHKHRNIPSHDGGSYLGPHLRFGTVSIRRIVMEAWKKNRVFLSELIWREFFMQILFHFPRVVDHAFREKYDRVEWQNDKEAFERWKNGTTGYPMVDAGMRQLNETGYMHNRVRMITASFLCKHLLIDWRWGEAYFAAKLLDYELSSNNGNWQWAAGTGCDAAPYFRVFNPWEQQKKFDPEFKYVRTWVSDFDKPGYPDPMVDHKFARGRAIETYRRALD